MPSLIPRPRLHSSTSSSNSNPQHASRTFRPADDVTLLVAPQQKQQLLQGGKPAASANTDRGPRDGHGAGPRTREGEISTHASPPPAEKQESSPSNNNPGLFNRLLKRGKSLKRKPRPSARGISAPNELNSTTATATASSSRPRPRPDNGGAIAGGGAGPQQQQGFSNSPPQISSALPVADVVGDHPSDTTPIIPADPELDAETAVPPDHHIDKLVPQQAANENAPEISAMAKPIARKPSLRDRFRLKATATPSPDEQRKTPVIYIPKHAASDFSRMAVTSRPRASYSFDEDRTLSPRTDEHGVDAGALTRELEELQIKPNRHSSTLQPLLETEPDLIPHEIQPEENSLPKQENRKGHHRNESTSSSQPRGQRQRHSHTKSANAGDISSPTVPSQPQTHRHQPSAASVPSPVTTQRPVNRNPNAGIVPQKKQEKAGLSDYELFLQQAEEEDRVQRERMRQGIPYRVKTQPPPLNPFYTTNFAPVAPALDDIRETTDQRNQTTSQQPSEAPLMTRTGLAAGGGSRSSGTRTKRDSSQYGYQLHSGPIPSTGNTNNRGSWSASNEAEKEKERKTSSGGQIPEYTLPVSTNYVGASSGVQYQAREPRGLKRQGSITQRIAEYIRPTRERSRYEPTASSGTAARQ